MASYTVIGVRKVLAADYSHRHIDGVCTEDRVYHSRTKVIASIGAGDTWTTKAAGYEETILVASECPESGCTVAPYLATKNWSPRKDNLENLDPC